MKASLALAFAAAGIGAGLGAGEAHAQLAIGGGIGTTGGKIEAEYQTLPGLVVRGGYNYFQYGSIDGTYDNVHYTGDLDLSTLGAFLDYHPFGGGFMLTAGGYFGDKKLDLVSGQASTYTIGGQTFTSAQTGELRFKGNLEKNAPFIGLGWDTTYAGSGHWGFKFIAGAMFTGKPDVTLTSVGGVRTPTQEIAFQQALRDAQTTLQSDVNDYKVYPVVETGLTYRF
jgi:hypothetical protein